MRAAARAAGDRLREAGLVPYAVAPYAPRARPEAPVAAPLHWEELAERTLKPDRWTVASIAQRIDDEGDPWTGMGRRARSLPQPTADDPAPKG